MRSAGIDARNGALGKIRTPDPQIRSLVLYPAELRALCPARGARPRRRMAHHRRSSRCWQVLSTTPFSGCIRRRWGLCSARQRLESGAFTRQDDDRVISYGRHARQVISRVMGRASQDIEGACLAASRTGSVRGHRRGDTRRVGAGGNRRA